MITFHNPGAINPLLMTTFGASIKDSEQPIGMFGTGFKHAIATILRGGGKVTISAREDGTLSLYTFTIEPQLVRGQSIDFISITSDLGNGNQTIAQAGFTTNLGKNWKPWMAYRELWSNAKDEGGSATNLTWSPDPDFNDYTKVMVDWSEFDQVYTQQDKYILASRPIATIPGKLEVHIGATDAIFYRGILAGKLPKAAAYTYNILQDCPLTEDRTIPDWHSGPVVARGLLACENKAVIYDVLTAKDDTYESTLDFNSWTSPGADFVTVASSLAKNRSANLNRSAYEKLKAYKPGDFLPSPTILTGAQASMLRKAQAFCAAIGQPVTASITISADLGDGVMGCVLENKIFISLAAFEVGTKMVAGTLLEEHLHISRRVNDGTRSMQNVLVDLIVSTYENLKGEPL